MMNRYRPTISSLTLKGSLLGFLSLLMVTCKKDNQHKRSNPIVYPPRLVHYKVSGTHLRLNYIDSASVFQSDQVVTGSFDYQFKRGPGTSIGITVNPADSTDVIYSWEVYIDNKLYANAVSEGGAYFNIPYP